MLATNSRYRHLTQFDGYLNNLHRHRITPSELIYILSFVFNFATGKLLHLFSQEEEVYNYYNNKGNIFNQYFVKKGWGWTTAVILFFYIIKALYTKTRGGKFTEDNTKEAHVQRVTSTNLLSAAFRYFCATAWWILFTQWCFGLPIMDKVFLWTGGKCTGISEEKIAAHLKGKLLDSKVFQKFDQIYESSSVSSMVCRRLRGSWEGGHDPLGHVFLLVHSSLYMFFEMKEHWCGFGALAKDIRQLFQQRNRRLGLWTFLKQNPETPLILLMALWWYMLLMTNMYFHLLAEKLVGLAFGYFGIFAVYLMPRWL